MQIVQNNSYNIKKACEETKPKKKPEAVGPSSSCIDDDAEGTKRHITELCDEWKKKSKSKEKAKPPDKLVRLFSITHKYRSKELLDKTSVSRINVALEKYPMMKKPLFVRTINVRGGSRGVHREQVHSPLKLIPQYMLGMDDQDTLIKQSVITVIKQSKCIRQCSLSVKL